MPCILKVRVVAARDLPVMDKKTDNTDAYVEIKFASHEAQRTSIQRKTLNPQWNEDFRLECSDDAEVQDEVVEFRVLDYDSYTANDSIGSVYIDLSPLITLENRVDLSQLEQPQSPNSRETSISGWFPIYDTLRGTRGELNLVIKLEYFGDLNPFKDSSAGVLIFSGGSVPEGCRIETVMGLVSAILVEDDPEYHWADSFRAPKFSNEARQKLLYRLSGQLRRQIGREVLEVQGNAIVGYKQYFDFENEESVITARAIGTCVQLINLDDERDDERYPDDEAPKESSQSEEMSQNASLKMQGLSGLQSPMTMFSLGSKQPNNSQDQSAPVSPQLKKKQQLASKQISSSTDVVLMTMKNFPPGAVLNMGGLVSARSVKLFTNEDQEEDEEDLRDGWWDELREEVEQHAKSLGCRFVLNYEETVSICDELVVLSAVGTAANLNLKCLTSETARLETFMQQNIDQVLLQGNVNGGTVSQQSTGQDSKTSTFALPSSCQACHVPYTRKKAPFPVTLGRCLVCRKPYVPEILFTNIEPPLEIQTVGSDVYLEAHLCRSKKRREGESNASAVSDALPFIEYDLHRQLVYKLRILGMNSIFGFKIKLCLGDTLIVAVASGTASYLAGLPAPPPLKIMRSLEVADAEDQRFVQLQNKIMQVSEDNRIQLDLKRHLLYDKLEVNQPLFHHQEENGIPQDYDLKSPNIAQSFPPAGALMQTPVKRNRKVSQQQSLRVTTSDVQRSVADNDEDNETLSETSTSSSDSDLNKKLQTTNIVVQIDDDTDEDLLAVLLDRFHFDDEESFARSNTGCFRSDDSNLKSLCDFINFGTAPPDGFIYQCETVSLLKQLPVTFSEHHMNRQLSDVLHDIYCELRAQMLCLYDACIACSIELDLVIDSQSKEDNALHIRVGCQLVGARKYAQPLKLTNQLPLLTTLVRKDVYITPHDNIPGMRIAGYVDRISLHFINEEMNVHSRGQSSFGRHFLTNGAIVASTLPRTGSGIARPSITSMPVRRLFSQASSVIQSSSSTGNASLSNLDGVPELDTNTYLSSLTTDVTSLVKAHTESLGGDAVCSYKVEVCSIKANGAGARSRVYSVLCVSGDVVELVKTDSEVRPATLLEAIWNPER